MKTIIIVLLTLCLGTPLVAQNSVNAYYDAKELATYVKNVPALGQDAFDDLNHDKVVSLLKVYYPSLSGLSNRNFAIKLVDPNDENYNPFLNDYLQSISTEGSGFEGAVVKSALVSSPGGIAGLNVTNLATGISKFLIERANQEINILFFDKFKEFLKENEEASTLFPNSANFIINSQPHQYAILLQAFREAFKEDIQNLVNQLDDLLLLDRYQDFGHDHPEAYAGLAAVVSVSKLIDGGNIADVIKSLGQFQNPADGEAKNLYASIKLMAILSESIRSKDSGNAWVSTSDIETQIIGNDKAIRIYFGLIYKQVEGIEFEVSGSSQAVQGMLKSVSTDISRLRPILEYFGTMESSWNTVKIAKLEIDRKKLKGESVDYTDYYLYFDKSLDLVDRSLNLNTFLSSIGYSVGQIGAMKEGRNYLNLLRTGNQIYKNINEKNYSSAVLNFVIAYESIIGEKINNDFLTDRGEMKAYLSSNGIVDPNRKVVKKYKKEIVRLGGGIVANYKTEFDRIKREESIGISHESFLRYTSFMAALVEADSPDVVKSIIQSAALPAGSYSIKRNAKFNISLQSYLGIYYNFDHDSQIDRAWNNRIGVTAPVGVSFNWGLKRKMGALGVMISLIDVGAIVDYEIRTDTTISTTVTMEPGGNTTTTTTEVMSTEADYKIELAQIFSPGLYGVWSLPGRIPLSLGVGLQYGPGLTEINNDSGNPNLIIGDPKIRFNVFLAFDIPILTLSNSSR
ncbi:hypothetical protein [Roseivirga echinicomitans]|uniref:Uncharacterized protein n=1 Tax=Roseivirga echinicomitans TaxID=296218 RepID=A0A150XV05_9BACT|nr:hypothetical protein [Roseivirga echinicomitans]KYG82553.1 hypothetical protein AWN68_14985 [Roseivirga echinicomitans]